MSYKSFWNWKRLLIVFIVAVILFLLFYYMVSYLSKKVTPDLPKIVEETLKAILSAILLLLSQLILNKIDHSQYLPKLRIFFDEFDDLIEKYHSFKNSLEESGLLKKEVFNHAMAEKKENSIKLKNDIFSGLCQKLEEVKDTPQAFKKINPLLFASANSAKNLFEGDVQFTNEFIEVAEESMTDIKKIIKTEKNKL